MTVVAAMLVTPTPTYNGQRMARKELFAFPNPVNEVAARVVAAGVLVMALLTLATRRPWLLAPLAYGFVARALTGPTLSPLGQISTRVITPRLPVEPKPVAGPPKRFAQSIGAGVTLSALTSQYIFRRPRVTYTLAGMIALFATLESVFAFCIGCTIFAVLMRLGLVPEEVCAQCANIWDRPSVATEEPSGSTPNRVSPPASAETAFAPA